VIFHKIEATKHLRAMLPPGGRNWQLIIPQSLKNGGFTDFTDVSGLKSRRNDPPTGEPGSPVRTSDDLRQLQHPEDLPVEAEPDRVPGLQRVRIVCQAARH